MAEALISIILERLGSIASQQVEQQLTLVVGIENDVRELTSNLQAIQPFLVDAEKKQEESLTVRLNKLRDVLVKIEDVLGEWNIAILQEKIKKDNKSSRKAYFPISSLRPIPVHRNIASKIKKLNEELDVIAKEMNMYGLIDSAQSSTFHNAQCHIMSTSFVDVSNVFGRDDDKKELIDMLLSESSDGSNLSIISVIGMGGLGKTTLAQLAYNDDRIRTHFEKRMWVYVSDSFDDPFDETRVAKAILEQLINRDASNLNELNSLIRLINEEIKGKKFLLVLDDVWCEDGRWCRNLEAFLKAGSSGSKILMTTRKEKVATTVGSTDFKLHGLGDKESLDLFTRMALGYSWNEKERENVKAPNGIVKMCKGLPLALKAIGGYLYRCGNNREAWSDVLKSEIWWLVEKEVFPIFTRSYDDLPPLIRQCFLYCAVFPKDYEIRKDHIINLWMAQGYLALANSIEMEEVGDAYFSELAMRFFFQDFEKTRDGMIISFKMHELMHDFALSLTKDECLAVEAVEERNLETLSYANTLHLMMMFEEGTIAIPISLRNFKSLRTLIFNDHIWAGATDNTNFDESFDKVIDQLTSLRTLDLSRTNLAKLPRNIGKLVHLKYLMLEGCENLKELPETVWNLGNLLVLDVRECRKLQRLPGGIEKVINLRQLKLQYSSIDFMPRGVNGLTDLRYLDDFVVSSEMIDKNEVSALSDLMNLNKLRGTLSICGLGNVREASEAKKANLNKKEYLTDLRLKFNSTGGEEMEEVRRSRDGEVLEALQPHPNLQSLKICYYRGNMAWPNWMTSSVINLKHLKLLKCINCEVMPTLGKLPSLESLEIWGMKSVKRVGSELVGTSTSSASSTIFFPKLKILEFTSMMEWEEWDYTIFTQGEEEEESSDISATSSIISIMPCLQKLRIGLCLKLKRVPAYILNAPSLETLTIEYSPVLEEHMKRYFPDDSRIKYSIW